MFLFDSSTVLALKKDLDVGGLRQRVIANNLANFSTPGFKKSFVSFEEQLQRELDKRGMPLKTTHSRHIGGASHPALVKPQVVQVTNTSLRPDGNNVNVDEEMVNNAATLVKYNTSSTALEGHYGLINQIISGSRR